MDREPSSSSNYGLASNYVPIRSGNPPTAPTAGEDRSDSNRTLQRMGNMIGALPVINQDHLDLNQNRVAPHEQGNGAQPRRRRQGNQRAAAKPAVPKRRYRKKNQQNQQPAGNHRNLFLGNAPYARNNNIDLREETIKHMSMSDARSITMLAYREFSPFLCNQVAQAMAQIAPHQAQYANPLANNDVEDLSSLMNNACQVSDEEERKRKAEEQRMSQQLNFNGINMGMGFPLFQPFFGFPQLMPQAGLPFGNYANPSAFPLHNPFLLQQQRMVLAFQVHKLLETNQINITNLLGQQTGLPALAPQAVPSPAPPPPVLAAPQFQLNQFNNFHQNNVVAPMNFNKNAFANTVRW